jgi:diphthine-ammonia ligase
MKKAAISWSGGKDSCAAYHRARRDFDIVAAVTMFNEDGSRSRSHGLRPEVLSAQVERMGLQHLTEQCSWSSYDEAFSRALGTAAGLGVTHVIFGDILFEEHRAWATRLAEGQGLTAVEPLWGESTTDLYRDFLALGGRARIVTIRSSELDESFLGRELAAGMLDEFVALGVDPCGERGEYHTVVTDCPAFSRPLVLRSCGRGGQSGCVAEDLALVLNNDNGV